MKWSSFCYFKHMSIDCNYAMVSKTDKMLRISYSYKREGESLFLLDRNLEKIVDRIFFVCWMQSTNFLSFFLKTEFGPGGFSPDRKSLSARPLAPFALCFGSIILRGEYFELDSTLWQQYNHILSRSTWWLAWQGSTP